MKPRWLSLLLPLAACGGPAPPTGPHVILVSIDTLRRDHVGCYGYERETTPNLDRFAREGVRFDQEISSTSWTLPAHAAIFTSVPDAVHGVVDATGTALSPAFVTLAERFQAAGYATGGFYGGPYLDGAFGLGQGFDTYVYAVRGQRERFAPDKVEVWANNPLSHAASHHGVTNDAVYGEARAWMEEHKEQASFTFIHFWDVHYDFTPPPPWDTRFDPGYEGPIDGRGFVKDNVRYRPDMSKRDFEHLLALYDGEIGWTDTFLGKLRADLESWGIADDTILIITSDHGTEFFDHGHKGHRQTLFDEVVRVPLVLWAPGRVPEGSVVTHQTRSIDLGPTLLELANLAPPEGVLGRSLMPLVEGAAPEAERAAVCELHTLGFELQALRLPDGKFLRDEARDSSVWFDLEADPGEHAPQRELDSGRGARLRDSYTHALAELARAIEERPEGAVATDLSDELRDELRANGYIGEDE